MKQIIQSFKTGETILEEVPSPLVGRGQLLIKTTRSLVSLGTERMLVEFGKASLIQKARQQIQKHNLRNPTSTPNFRNLNLKSKSQKLET